MRTKVTDRIKTWSEADEALLQIGRLERRLKTVEDQQQRLIDNIKAESKKKADPLIEKKARLELELREFAEARKSEFGASKSKVLTFGTIGFRKSTKLLVKRVSETLRTLKSLGLWGCIRVKESIDKDALKKLPAEQLLACGARLKSEETFGYDLNQELISEEGMVTDLTRSLSHDNRH